MCRKFWWGEQEDKKKFHTIKLEEICKPIFEEGLGIQDSNSNDLALLAKTCLRLLSNENILCSKVLKAKYCPRKSLWEASGKMETHGSRGVSLMR